jgi:hypothetical protein
MARRRLVVELADPRTWPGPLAALAREVADTVDLDDVWTLDDAPFIEALNGASLRTYHCTRLTDRETFSIRADGLRLLTPELANERITNAVADGHLTEDEGALYSRTLLPQAANRRGRIGLIGDRDSLSNTPDVGYLLSIWGGEGINMAWPTHSAESKRLELVGTPSVVVVLFDPAVNEHRAHPGLTAAAVTRVAADPGSTAITCTVPLAGDRIEAIEHPRSQFWRRYVRWVPKSPSG